MLRRDLSRKHSRRFKLQLPDALSLAVCDVSEVTVRRIVTGLFPNLDNSQWQAHGNLSSNDGTRLEWSNEPGTTSRERQDATTREFKTSLRRLATGTRPALPEPDVPCANAMVQGGPAGRPLESVYWLSDRLMR